MTRDYRGPLPLVGGPQAYGRCPIDEAGLTEMGERSVTGSRTAQWAAEEDARWEAAQAARSISEHHRVCRVCHAGGRLAVTRRGLARLPCEEERRLFAGLARAAAAGWPES